MTNWTEETIKPHMFTEVQCRNDDEWGTGQLIGYYKNYSHPFCITTGRDTNRFKQMRLIPKKKWIDWTPETAPFPLALRKKNWPKGVYELFQPEEHGVYSISNDEGGYMISFEDLVDSCWEQRDGSPCGQVVDGGES